MDFQEVHLATIAPSIFVVALGHTVDGRNPAPLDMVNPIIFRVSYIPGGAGFQPSTVSSSQRSHSSQSGGNDFQGIVFKKPLRFYFLSFQCAVQK